MSKKNKEKKKKKIIEEITGDEQWFIQDDTACSELPPGFKFSEEKEKILEELADEVFKEFGL